jgi:purine-binding chemotaxis protein CheW
MTVLEPLAPGSRESGTLEDSEGGKGRYPAVLVRSGSRLWALPVQHVVETLRPLPVEPVPGAPSFVLGMAVIRGEPVPVVDLGSLLGDSEKADVTRYVTLRIGARRVAVAVERVLGLRDIDAGLQREMPPLLQDLEDEKVGAVAILDGELLLVLRTARLVSDELWEVLASAGRAPSEDRDAR